MYQIYKLHDITGNELGIMNLKCISVLT